MRPSRLFFQATLILSIPASLLLGSFPAQGSGSSTAQRKPSLGPESATIESCFSSGSGATFFKVCVSDHGNIVSIEAPSGQVHIPTANIEGYELCHYDSDGGFWFLTGYDAKSTESGFGPATITQPGGPNTLPLTISRDTTDGMVRLSQSFARDKVERDFTITMTVKNLSQSLQELSLYRYFDGDLDGDASDDIYDHGVPFGTGGDSVWGRDIHGLSLTASTFGIPHFPKAEAFADLYSHRNTCGVPEATAPTPQGDYGGEVSYVLTVPAGVSKAVKFTYRVF